MERKVREFTLGILNTTAMEIHYCVKRNCASIDAQMLNGCERELLAIVKEVAYELDCSINIVTEPYKVGEISRWYQINPRRSTLRDLILSTLVFPVTLHLLFSDKLNEELATVVVTETKGYLEQIRRAVVDTDQLTEEQDKSYLELLQFIVRGIDQRVSYIIESSIIHKRRSGFYKEARSSRRVERVEASLTDQAKQLLGAPYWVERTRFADYITKGEAFDKLVIEDVDVEVVAPVLRLGNHKWKVIYNDELISCNMLSEEFLQKVILGKVEFRNGATLNCNLELTRRIDHNGDIRITDYTIEQVNSYFFKGFSVETIEGRKARRKREIESHMGSLFDELY